MKKFYSFKNLLVLLLLVLCGQISYSQTLYDWQTTAPDGNWRQGAGGAPRWNPGGLWDEPPSTSATRLRFNNNTFTTMNNNVAGTYTIGQLFFGSSATTSRTLSGGSLQFFEFGGTWPRIENQSTTLHVFNIPFTASSNSGFNMELVANAGNIDFGGTINNNGRTIQIYGNNATTDGANRSIRLGGVVSGSGILNVSQFGVVKLNAAHTYTGQTTIDNGELWIESAGSIAAGSGIFVGNGGQLGNVTKFWISNGAGGTTVSNALTINNGNLTTREIGGLNTSGTHTFSGNITNNSTTGGLLLSTINAGGTVNYSGVLSGAGAYTVSGPGTTILSGASANTYTGVSSANGGTLVLNKTANTIAIPTNLTVATGVTIRTDAANQWGAGTPPLVTLNGTATLNLNNNNQRVALSSASSTSTVTLGSATLDINNTGTDTYAGTITGTGGVTKTNTGTQVLSNTGNSYTGTTTITGGILRLGAAGVIPDASNVVMNGGTLSTGAAAGFAETMGTLALTASSTLALGTGSHNVTFAASNAVAWTANTILTVTGWTGTNNGNSSGTAGRLFVGNTAGGLTGLQLSRIRFNISSVLCGAMQLSTGEVVPTSSACLYWGGTAAQSWTSATWSAVETGPFTSAWVSGSHCIFNVASSTITGATANVAAITANENVTVTPGGTIAFGPAGTSIAPIRVEGGRTFNFNGQALTTSATAGIIKNGTGILNMGAGGAFAGGFTLNAGIAAAGGVNGLGNGPLVINGGTITSNSATARIPAVTSITVNADFQLGDVVNFAAATGNLTFTSTVALGASVRTITLGNASTQTFSGIISGTGAAGLTLAATAAGTLAISGANTYPGATTVNGGTLQCGIANTLPSTTNVTLANTAGATLNLNNFAQTIASLSGGGATGGNIATGSAILTVNQSSNTTYAGVISGTGGLTKTGSGTLTLSGANTYTGLTTITAGTLQLGAANVIAAGNVVLNGGTLSTGATTGFSEIVGTLDLNANSIINLGTGVHDLTFANSSAVTWAGTTLTINGWAGTAGSSGTAGRIFFSSSTGLIAGQLSKIIITGFPGTPILLPSGELVPALPAINYTWNGLTNNTWATPTNWTPNGTPGSGDNVIINAPGTNFNLVITGAQSINNFTLNGTGNLTITSTGSLNIAGDLTTGGTPTTSFDCASTITISSASAQTIPAFNYGNLNLTGGNRTLANAGTIGICGTFTRGAGTYTVTGSTVNFNGTGAQTIAAGTYNNLTISNSRGAAVATLPAGTISVVGVFDVSTYASTANPSNAVNAASIFDFTSGGVQAIPAFFYGQLNNTGNGNRTWANAGIIDINQGFTPGTGTHTITNSTVRYSATTGTFNLATFTTNVTTPARLYNNLIFNGTGGTWTSNGITLGIAGNLNVTAGTFVGGATPGAPFNGGSTTINIDGNFTLDGGTFNLSSSSTATNSGTINLLGNFNQSAGLFNKSGSQTGIINFIRSTGPQTITQSGGTITNNGTTWNFGNGTTTNTVQLASNFVVGAGTVIANQNATVNFQNFVLSGTTAFTAIGTSPGTTLITANVDGISGGTTPNGSVQSTGTRTFQSGVNYTFNATTAQNTGIAVNPSGGGQSVRNLTIDNPTTVTLTSTGGSGNASDAVQVSNILNLVQGILILNTRDLQLNPSSSIAGAPFSASKMIVTIGAANRNNGRLLRPFPATTATNQTFTYPVGDITGTPEYTPFTITDLDYTTAGGGPFVAVKVKDAKAPFDASVDNFLTRTFEVTTGTSFGGATVSNFTFEANYITGASDVVGNDNLFKVNRFSYTLGTWVEDAASSCGSGILTSASLTNPASFNDHDITGRLDAPLYFRSVTSGVWENPAVWQASTDPAFISPAPVTPSTYPIFSNSAGIQIRSTHNVTVTTPSAFGGIPLDQTTVDLGGTLTIQSTASITVANGVGTDLIVNGTLVNSSASASSVTGTIQFSSTGVYNHSVNSGTVPAATWDAGSLCTISGTTTLEPSGLTQTFSDFTWNCTGQSAARNLSGTLTSARDVIIQSTNGFTLGLTSTTAMSSTFRNLTINSGFLTMVTGVAGTNTVAVNVTNDVTINGGGLTVSGASATGTGTTTFSVGNALSNVSSAGTSLVVNGGARTAATLTIGNGYTQNNTTGSVSLVQSSGAGTMTITSGNYTLTTGNFYLNNGGTGVATLNQSNGANSFNVNGGSLALIQTTTAPGTRPLITIAGNFAQTAGNIEFSTAYTGGLNPPGEIQVAGNFTRSGTGYIRNTSATNNALIAFNGTTQAYNTTGVTGNFTYTNVTINSGSTLTLASDLALSNTTTPAQTVTVNGRLNCGTNLVSGALTTATAFTLNTAGTLSIGSLDGITTAPTAAGNIQTGVRNFNAGSYIYAGANNQVTGNGLPASVAALQVANTGSSPNNVVTLTNASASTGALTFTSGMLDLAANNFTAGSVAGAGTNQYVRTSSTGVLRQVVGATQVTFPIGNSAYNPFQITNSGTSDTYGARVLDVITSPTPNDPDLLINRYWVVNEAVAGGSNLAVTAQYNSGEEGVNFATGTTLKIGLFPVASWVENNASSAGSGPFVVSSGANFTAVGTFGVGKDLGFINPTTTYTWVGNGAAGDWTDPDNWNPNTSAAGPLPGDNIIINAPGTAGNNLSLNITRTIADVTINGTGSMTLGASGNLTINGNVTYGGSFAATLNCGSTINYANPAALTIPPFNYGNLTNANVSVRTWTAAATTGICGTLTTGTGSTFTAGAGSTVNYNGTGAQTIAPLNYVNLTISNNRASANLTSPAGTIAVSGTFDISTLSNYTPVVNAASIFDFTGAAGQVIPAFFYGQLNNSSNTNRVLASSGVIDIAQGFTPSTATTTITGSTIRYSDVSATSWTLTNFTSNVVNRQYNNLEFVGGASTSWSLNAGFNLGCTGNLTISGAGTLNIATNATANTAIVDGNLTLSGTGNIRIANTATATLVNSLTVTGNTTISNGLLTCVGSSSGTTVQGNFTTNDLTISGTGAINLDAASNTANAAVTVNGNLNVTSTVANAINFGSGTSNANNIFNLRGNFSKSGTGTIGLSGSYNPTAVFNFNGVTTQTYTHTGAAQTGGGYTVASGSTLQLLNNLTSANSSNSNPINIAGTLDCQGFAVVAANATNTFALNATGTLRTSSSSGVAGAVTGFTAVPSFVSGGSFEFYGTAVNTGFSTFTGINTSNLYTITWTGNTSLTLDKSVNLNSFNFTNSGLVFLGNFDIALPSAASGLTGTGFGVTKMFVTNGTGSLSRAVLNTGVGLPFTWPIGENTGTLEYSPVSVNSIASAGINGTIAFRVVDGVQSNNFPSISYITRYWPTTVTGFNTGYTLSNLTFTYVAGDIVVGPEASLRGNSYSTTTADWTQYPSSSCASNVLTITSGVGGANMPTNGTYDIMARIDVPVYYRSVTSGPWQTLTTWEVSSDPAFINPAPSTPVQAPNNINSEGITIRNTHTVTTSSTIIVDDLTIESGGTMNTTNNSFTVANGVAASDVIVNSGGTLQFSSASNNSLVVNTGAVILVNGTMRQSSSASPDVSNSGTINIGSTGTYDHARNAGIIPTCNWASGSTCLLSAITNNVPTGLGQSFHHFTVNSTITASVNCSGNLQTINGDFNLTTNSATNGFRLSTGTTYTLVVGGNLIINNGLLDPASGGSGPCTVTVNGNTTMNGANSRIDKTGASTVTFNFNGDYTQNAGTFDFNSGGSSNTTVNFRGNVIWNGSVLRTNGGTHIINFDKLTGLQTLTCGATFGAGAVSWNIGNSTTNTVRLLSNLALNNSLQNFTVNNGAIFDCGAFVLTGGNTSFILSATGGLKSGNANGIYTVPTALGSIQTLNRTYPGTASYFYNGTINQFTGNGLPNTLTTTGNINIENTGSSGNNTVTLTNNNTTTPTFNLISGLFAADTPQQLNITSGGTVNATGGDFATGATAGLLNFPGTGTFTGSCSPYNVHIAGGVNFGAGTVTIQNGGRLRILAGGFVNTNAPAYAVGSTLEYNTGGNYDRGVEWSTASGKGFPHHVSINTSTLNPARTGATFAATTFNVGGNLSITSGGNIYMDFGGNNMTVPLIVNGDLTLVGQLSGSASVGGDIRIRGNWINDGVATNNFFPNSRAVFFDGSTAQTIGGTNTGSNPFAFVFIDNTSGVSLLRSQTIINQLTHTNGLLSLGNFNLTMSPGSTITGASSVRYTNTNGTGRLIQQVVNGGGDKVYPIGTASAYAPVTLNQGNTTDNIGVRVTTAPPFIPSVNDANQMVSVSYNLNESVPGGNNLTTTFQWPAISEAAGFIRANSVYHGDWTGTAYQIRVAGATGGSNPYTSTAGGFINDLNDRTFVVGNLLGIIPCISTIAAGDWNTGGTWSSPFLPPSGATVCISHPVTVSVSNPNDMNGVTINSGGSLTIAPLLNINFLSNGSLDNNSGSIQNLGSGSLTFLGSGTIGGAQALTINNVTLNGTMTMNTAPTINGTLQINSGFINSNSPIFTSTSLLRYSTGGAYVPSIEWTGNSSTPGAGVPQNVEINGGTILNMPINNRGLAGDLSINNGSLNLNATTGDLYLGGNWTRNSTATFNPNNRAVFFNGLGTQVVSTTGGGTESFPFLFITKPSGIWQINSLPATNVSVTGNSGTIFSIFNTASLDINGRTLAFTGSGGNINANGGIVNINSAAGGFFTISGGTKTITSTAGGSFNFGGNTVVLLSNGLNFGSGLSTINGTLRIILGGFVTGNAPFYGSNSTLHYFTGTNYFRGLEWSASSGAGYPFNVQISRNGTNTGLFPQNLSFPYAQIAGNLKLDNGGTINMNSMTDDLNVRGSVIVGDAINPNFASMLLSLNTGADLIIGGDLILNNLNADAFFSPNGREIEFDGSINQNIVNVTSFNFLKISNTSGGVRLQNNVIVSNRLWLNNGTFDLNGFTANIAGGSQIRRSSSTATMTANPTIGLGQNYDIRYDASMTTGNEFIATATQVRDVEINNATLTLGANRTFNRDLILNSSNLDLNGFTMVARGRAAAPAFSGSINVAGGGTRNITGPAGSLFDITGLGGNQPLDYTKTVSTFGGTLLNFDSNVTVRIGDGAVDFGVGSPTTINGVLQVLLGGSVGQILNPCFYGVNSILRFANTVDYQVGLNDKTWAAGAIASNLPGIPWNVEVNDAGTDLQLQNIRALRNNLTIAGGTFTLTAAYVGPFNIGGNWTRTGATSTFTHNNKLVIFNRQTAGNQTISVGGTITAETFFDLEISTLTGEVQLGANSNLNVLNNLNFVSGKFNLGSSSNTLRIGTGLANGSITGYDATKYIISNGGKLRLSTNSNGNYIFPIGDATDYTRFELDLTAGATANAFIDGTVFSGVHPNFAPMPLSYINRFWRIEPTGLTTSPVPAYNARYYYTAADVVGAGIIKAVKYSYSNPTPGWLEGPPNSGGGPANGVEGSSTNHNTGTREFEWNGLQTFSDFTGAGDGGPLPITLIAFNAQPVNNTEVLTTWSTASEINNHYFTIYRSKDAVHYEVVGNVDGAGNSNTVLSYQLTDSQPYTGLSYYKLRQTDFNGDFEEFAPVAVLLTSNNSITANVFPNPTTDLVSVSLNSKLADQGIIQIFDIAGALVWQQNIQTKDGANLFQYDVSSLAVGKYIISVKLNRDYMGNLPLIINR